MFELKITTNTAAEARQDLELFLGRIVQGEVLTIDAGDPHFDAAVEARVAKIDTAVKAEVVAMHNQIEELLAANKKLFDMNTALTQELTAVGATEAEKQMAKQLAAQDAPDRKEVKRSHKAKPVGEDTVAIHTLAPGEPTTTAAPPWVEDEAALIPPTPEPASIDPATVRLALADLAEAKGRAALEAILAKFNARSFSKLDPTTFEDVLEAVAQVMKP